MAAGLLWSLPAQAQESLDQKWGEATARLSSNWNEDEQYCRQVVRAHRKALPFVQLIEDLEERTKRATFPLEALFRLGIAKQCLGAHGEAFMVFDQIVVKLSNGRENCRSIAQAQRRSRCLLAQRLRDRLLAASNGHVAAVRFVIREEGARISWSSPGSSLRRSCTSPCTLAFSPDDLGDCEPCVGDFEVALEGYELLVLSRVPLDPGTHRTHPPASMRRSQGMLKILGAPKGAVVIDKQTQRRVGSVPELRLHVGTHALDIRHEEYEPWTVEVTIRRNLTTTIRAPMARRDRHKGKVVFRSETKALNWCIRGPDDSCAPRETATDLLPPGQYELKVWSPERQPWSGPIMLRPGQTTTVDVDFVSNTHEKWLWISGGTLAAAGLVLGGFALLNKQGFEDDPSRSAWTRSKYLGPAADITLASAAVLMFFALDPANWFGTSARLEIVTPPD